MNLRASRFQQATSAACVQIGILNTGTYVLTVRIDNTAVYISIFLLNHSHTKKNKLFGPFFRSCLFPPAGHLAQRVGWLDA